MGWAPDRATARSSRLVKIEYVFMPYKPQHALLTGKKLTLKASVDVGEASGQHPELASSTRTAICSWSPDSLVVTGEVSATGPSRHEQRIRPGPEPGRRAPVPPDHGYSARQRPGVLYKAPTLDPLAMHSWYDLCPNGDVRGHSTGGPCTSPTLLANADAELGSASFRGWKFISESKVGLTQGGTRLGTPSQGPTSWPAPMSTTVATVLARRQSSSFQ